MKLAEFAKKIISEESIKPGMYYPFGNKPDLIKYIDNDGTWAKYSYPNEAGKVSSMTLASFHSMISTGIQKVGKSNIEKWIKKTLDSDSPTHQIQAEKISELEKKLDSSIRGYYKLAGETIYLWHSDDKIVKYSTLNQASNHGDFRGYHTVTRDEFLKKMKNGFDKS